MNTNTPKTLGRPRKFDKENALSIALNVFREKGYEGTSIADITEAVGINRPSLYSAFGNKEDLFKRTLELYFIGPIAYLKEVLEEKTSREVVTLMLTKSVDLLSSTKNSRGCLAIQSSVSSELSSAGIQPKLLELLVNNEARIRTRFEKAVRQGDLPDDSDPSALARFVTTIHKGLSMQAANGASKEEMMSVVKHVMKTWPGK